MKNLAQSASLDSDDKDAPSKPGIEQLAQSVTIQSRGNLQGFEYEVKGRLAALIGGSVFPEGYGGSMVAEAGLEPATYGL